MVTAQEIVISAKLDPDLVTDELYGVVQVVK
jgi:hypothetical protein